MVVTSLSEKKSTYFTPLFWAETDKRIKNKKEWLFKFPVIAALSDRFYSRCFHHSKARKPGSGRGDGDQLLETRCTCEFFGRKKKRAAEFARCRCLVLIKDTSSRLSERLWQSHIWTCVCFFSADRMTWGRSWKFRGEGACASAGPVKYAIDAF